LALVPAVLLALDGRAKILATRRQREIIPAALAAYAPEFVVYTSRPDDASYQITMWLPYLRRAGRRFVIVTRDRVPAEVLGGLTDVPVVESRRIADLDAMVVPSLRAAFYVNASSGNGAFVRYHHLTHVYLGHGDSDKPPSYNPTHAMYDQVFAAGPAATRRYADHGVRIPAEKFRVVGRPQAEDVHRTEARISEVDRPLVLYAPTWKGHVEETMLYSLPAGERIVSALLARGASVIFRPHPFSYEDPADAATIRRIQALLAADAAATGRPHRWGPAAESELGILDCMNISHAMVTDVSSVVSDYLFSGKPFAMIAVPSEPDAFRQEYPASRASYVVRGDLGDLEPALDQMLGDDPMAETRASVRADYLGDFPAETYADAFVDAVSDVATRTRTSGAGTDDEEVRDAAESETSTAEGGSEAPADTPVEDQVRGGLLTRMAGYRRVLESIVLNLAGTALALVALTAALLGAPPWASVLIGLAGFLVGGSASRRDLIDRLRWDRLLGRLGATRALLLALLLILGQVRGASLPVLAVAVVLLSTALVGESFIARCWGRIGLEVRDFPEVSAEVVEPVPRGLVPITGSAALLLGLVLTAIGMPALVTGILALAAFVVFVEALTRGLLRARLVVGADERFPAALQAYAPEFVVYFSSTVGAAYQVGMWLPYFERIGRRYLFVTRTVPMLREIAQVTASAGVRVPIVFRPTLRSVEEIVVPSLSAAFYVNNAARNSHLVERRELTHVWLNHGDSEKPACYNPVHAIYDLLFAAGQAGVDRYARHGVTIPTEKFRIVGRPQVEVIRPASRSVDGPPTVLYAPTWQGPFSDSRVFSLPVGRQIVQALLDRGARVVFRAHPFNYRYRECVDLITDIGRLLAADKAQTGRDHLWGPAAEQAMTVEDCFNASDAMISDVSAVVSDYLRSDKPFAIVSVGRTPEQLLVEAPAARAAYVLREDLSNLTEVCDDLLDTDPLAGERALTRVYYLGDFPEPYADGFLEAARAVIDRRDTVLVAD
ncbi:MAG TPA: CDP-glycerol glycerophosphotransferase family protein, partial [Microlunatus sp.]|nr:CDP-glycerol glycerophosphotransferase family protein [Microlunatus sp.]